MPDHWTAIDGATADRPFRLVAAPARNFLNTSFTETPTSRGREGRPTAMLHPEDAARLGVADGGLVALGNAQGEVVVHARVVDGMQPGVVVVESVWPNADFRDGDGHQRADVATRPRRPTAAPCSTTRRSGSGPSPWRERSPICLRRTEPKGALAH